MPIFTLLPVASFLSSFLFFIKHTCIRLVGKQTAQVHVHTQACSGRIQKDRCPPTLHKSPYDIREIQTRLRGHTPPRQQTQHQAFSSNNKGLGRRHKKQERHAPMGSRTDPPTVVVEDRTGEVEPPVPQDGAGANAIMTRRMEALIPLQRRRSRLDVVAWKTKLPPMSDRHHGRSKN